jgi:hypothetical protein
MERLLLCLIHLLIIGSFISVDNQAYSQTPASTPDPQTGVIADIQPRQPPGKLKVRQKRGETPADGTIGMPVRRGYLLTLAARARATVRCADDSTHELEVGPQPCPCTSAGGTQALGDLPRPRGTDTANSAIPIIISPRGTLLLNTRPTLRWTAVPKSTSDASTVPTAPVYRVSIYTDNMKLVWSKEGIKKTELAYPSDMPELAPGDYLLMVSTDTGSSDQENGAGHGFTVLPKCSDRPARNGNPQCLAKQVRDKEKRLRQLNLPNDSTRLLIANLYASNELYAEAIEELNEVLNTAKTPAVMRQLGGLYASIGLNREAEKTYSEALKLLQAENDPEGQALTLYALALTYETLGILDQAQMKYDEAIKAYENLGDNATVTELKNQRARVERKK